MNFERVFWGCIVLVNLFSFFLMGWDKRCAIRHKRRIPEKTLFFFAWVFGGIGIAAGMAAFRHKTLHWTFRFFVPLGIIFDSAILCLVFFVI